LLILAFESSAKPASVAVCSEGNLLGQYFQNSGLTHSRTLLAMAESLLKNLELKAGDIGIIAVARGPGSFTGVRIGVSAAKGMAWGLGIPVYGVSTLEAMGYQTPQEGVLISPVMDARRGQVYNALFKWRNKAPVRVCKDRVISLEELASDLTHNEAPCMLVGDGAEMSYKYLSNAGISCSITHGLMRFQTAYGVALATENATPVQATELEPSYLRPSQAEQIRKRKEERGE
jgi:tRNA threonylcarbamoyladenosine biosynthesis protein TsaB